MIVPTLIKTAFCTHRIFYSFTASDGSEGTTAGRVVSPCSIVVHHGFRSKEVRRARKQYIDYTKQHHTPHSWLSTILAKRLSWLTRSTQFFIVVESSNIYSKNEVQCNLSALLIDEKLRKPKMM